MSDGEEGWLKTPVIKLNPFGVMYKSTRSPCARLSTAWLVASGYDASIFTSLRPVSMTTAPLTSSCSGVAMAPFARDVAWKA